MPRSTSSPVTAPQTMPTPSFLPGRRPAASRRLRSRSPNSSAARSSMPIPCRSIATCASSPRGRARPTRRACRICSTAMSTPPRIIRSAAGASMRRPRSRRRGEPGGCRFWWAAPGSTSRRSRRVSPRCRRSRPSVRASIRDRLAADGVAPLYAELQQRDPATAQRLMPGDRSRIARALEVVLATGRSLSDWHGEGMPRVEDRCRSRAREAVPRRRARRALSPHRCAVRRDAGVGRARRGQGACAAPSSTRRCRR